MVGDISEGDLLFLGVGVQDLLAIYIAVQVRLAYSFVVRGRTLANTLMLSSGI
jgi:hypothetical protein